MKRAFLGVVAVLYSLLFLGVAAFGQTEVTGNDGRIVITGGGPQKQHAKELSVVAHGVNAKMINFQAHELKSIWA